MQRMQMRTYIETNKMPCRAEGILQTYLSFLVKRRLLLILPLLLIYSVGIAQEKKMDDKIDLVFKSLIEKDARTQTSKKRCFAKKKNATSSSLAATKYDCIVYTKNPQALRDKGIIINSVLPTFVTASASLQQIQQMSSMPDVAYIASPCTDHLHDKK